MNSRTEVKLSENIPCDIRAGLGRSAHSPVAPAAAEEKNTLL